MDNNNNNNTIQNPASSSSKTREMEGLSLEISKYPRDLLQLATTTTNQSSSSSTSRLNFDPQLGLDEDEDDDGLNLGLGLSLGGKFGVDKYNKGLKRSSSIIGTMPLIREGDTAAPAAAQPPPALARTASLPLETEEEWRRRKELQTLRRMEAKRRRSEKQRVSKEGVGGGGVGEEKGVESLGFRGRLEKEQQNLGLTSKFGGSSNPSPNPNPNPTNPSPSPSPFGSSPSPKVEVKRRRTTFGSLQGFLMAQNQGCSGESQGGSSSGASEQHQGSTNSGEGRSPVSTPSTQDRGHLPDMTTPGGGFPGTKPESGPRRSGGPEAEAPAKQSAEGGAGIEDMPCVFTIGDGPHGRKVEGILYKYGRGEEVRIMCVCHGSFFSPAEFVKHAGGRDVDHPLRHIVVSPSPATFP